MGKNVKWKYEPYAFYNKKGIEERLSAMAAEGWFIEKMGRIWKYRKGDPAKRTYNVVYFRDAGSEEVENRQKSFVEYCKAAGWNLAVVTSGMLVFWHDGSNPVPIETEPKLELENIHESMKARFTSYFLIGFYAIMYIFELYEEWNMTPLNVLVSNHAFYLIIYILLAIVILFGVVRYLLWRKKSLKSVEELGIFCEVSHHPVCKAVTDFMGCVVVLVGSAFLLCSGELVVYVLVALLVFLLLGKAIKEKIRNNQRIQQLKEIKMPEIKQPWGFLLIMMVGLGLILGVFLLTYYDALAENEEKQIEKATVTLEDLREFDGVVGFDSDFDELESIFLKKVDFDQSVEYWNHNTTDDWIYFEYTCITVKWDFAYDFAFAKFCEQYNLTLSEWTQYENISGDVKHVYQSETRCIFVWDDAFAWIDFSWQPTEEQVKIVAEKLRSE